MRKLGMIDVDKKGRLVVNDNAPGIEKILGEKTGIKTKRQKPTCPVTGIEYDSNGEIYLSWYLNELQDKGYIKNWTAQPDSFILTNEVSRKIIIKKQLKTKVKLIEKKEIVVRGHLYTADFKIEWDQSAYDIGLVVEFDLNSTEAKPKTAIYSFSGISYLEAKPDGLDMKRTPDPKNMVRLFSNKQKEVYDKYGILVELIYHNRLFNDTFVPFRYLTHDKAKGNRAIKYNVILISQYIELNKKIDNYESTLF